MSKWYQKRLNSTEPIALQNRHSGYCSRWKVRLLPPSAKRWIPAQAAWHVLSLTFESIELIVWRARPVAESISRSRVPAAPETQRSYPAVGFRVSGTLITAVKIRRFAQGMASMLDPGCEQWSAAGISALRSRRCAACAAIRLLVRERLDSSSRAARHKSDSRYWLTSFTSACPPATRVFTRARRGGAGCPCGQISRPRLRNRPWRTPFRAW